MTYRIKLKKNDLLLLAAALLFSFAFATSPFSFFIYVAFVPLIKSLENSFNHIEAFRTGYIVGLIVNTIVFYWIIYYKFDSYILNIILNPIQFAVFAYLYSLLKAFSYKIRVLIFPFLWTFLEYFREFGDLALNWLNIGYTQGNYLSLIQIADISGLNGIVLWICFINLVVYNIIFKVIKFRYTITNYILIILLFILPYIYSQSKLKIYKSKKSILAAYMQPNVDSKLKWDEQQIEENINYLIKSSEKFQLDTLNLLVWPETAIPLSYQDLGNKEKGIRDLIKIKHINLLTGVLFQDSTAEIKTQYNSAMFFNPNNSDYQVYRKIKLVPIEEVLPYQELYDYLIQNDILKNFYKKGQEEKVFNASFQIYYDQQPRDIEEVKFSAIICFESSFPTFVKQFVNNGAEFLVVLTNDEWFGFSTQTVQHLITSRFRAIENRRSVIHCSNSGISSFIDYNGNFFGTSDLFQNHLEKEFIPLNNSTTLFGKMGDWIGKLSGIFILISFILIFYKKNRK